jgi:nitroreductase
MGSAETGMNVIDAIHRRRSVRDYAPQRLDQATIRGLLEAAVWAPTAVHQEPWLFSIVQDTGVLKSLSDRAKKAFAAQIEEAPPEQAQQLLDFVSRPDFNVFYNASTLIVVSAMPSGPFAIADCWLAAENLMLAACAMGLGSCVIGLAVAGLNTPEIKSELKIPSDCTAVAPIIVGVPRGETTPSTRREPRILHWC